VVLVGNQNNYTAETIQFSADGEIVSDVFFPESTSFPIGTDGSTNGHFSFTTILENNGIDRARLQISVTATQGAIQSRIFDDYAGTTSSFRGGVFSPDGRWIAISYIQTPNNFNVNRTIIRILDSVTLQDVATTIVDGFVPSLRFFSLKNNRCRWCKCGRTINSRLYLIAGTAHSIIPPTGSASLSVFRILQNRITLIDSVYLSQVPLSYSTVSSSEKFTRTLIAVGTAKTPFLPSDRDGLIIYAFDGKTLEKVFSRDTLTSIKALAWHPFDNVLATIQSSEETKSQFMILYEVLQGKEKTVSGTNERDTRDTDPEKTEMFMAYVKHFHTELNSRETWTRSIRNKCHDLELFVSLRAFDFVPLSPSANVSMTFSRDGRFLIAAGDTSGSSPSVDNVLIFRVFSPTERRFSRYIDTSETDADRDDSVTCSVHRKFI
jgi:hypothetical protein